MDKQPRVDLNKPSPELHRQQNAKKSHSNGAVPNSRVVDHRAASDNGHAAELTGRGSCNDPHTVNILIVTLTDRIKNSNGRLFHNKILVPVDVLYQLPESKR